MRRCIPPFGTRPSRRITSEGLDDDATIGASTSRVYFDERMPAS